MQVKAKVGGALVAPLIFLFLGPLFSFFAFLLHPLDSFLIDTGLWLMVAFSGLFYLKYRARLTSIEAEKGFFTRGLLFSPVFRLAVILLFGHLLFVFLLALKLPYWPPSRFWYLLDSGEHLSLFITLFFWLSRAYIEEFLFRYVPYQLAGSKGLLFSGVSFVFVHLVNPWTGVQLKPELILLYTVITLFLIGSFLFLRSLSMTSLVHALINMGFFPIGLNYT